jgi:formate hydrogenlyase subunit 5
VTTQELAIQLQERFDAKQGEPDGLASPGWLSVSVCSDRLLDAIRWLWEDAGCRFLISAGSDLRREWGKYLVTNLFAQDEHGIYLAVHTEVDPEQPSIPSITPIVPAANWTERELRDMIGVVPEGHPDPRRLVLADDWPEDLYPLRWDVEHGIKPPPSDCQVPREPPPEGSSVVPLGPYFPSLEEPAYFRLFVEGEEVVGADYRGFYNHRGIEKMGCSVLTYNQIPFIAERICGICGCVHSTAYCQAVEKAAGIEIPERAKYIRTIMLELERMQSHLLCMISWYECSSPQSHIGTLRVRAPPSREMP